MPSKTSFDLQTFPVLYDTKSDDTSMSPFMVSNTRGFLPRMEPLTSLPEDFQALENLLQRMPIKMASGSPGLLADGMLGETVDIDFPDLTEVIKKYRNDKVLMTALYRDYSFLASAYLLEPCMPSNFSRP